MYWTQSVKNLHSPETASKQEIDRSVRVSIASRDGRQAIVRQQYAREDYVNESAVSRSGNSGAAVGDSREFS